MSDTIKTLLISIALLLVICSAWFFLLYHPEKSKIDQIKGETSKLMLKLQSFRITEQQVAAMATQVEKLKNEVESSQARIITKENLPAIVSEIKAQGRKFGLKFQTIIPDYNSLIEKEDADLTVSNVQPLTLHMKLQGRYKNFGQFLQSLSTMRFSITLGVVNIVYNEVYYPDLDINLDVILYIYEEETQPGV